MRTILPLLAALLALLSLAPAAGPERVFTVLTMNCGDGDAPGLDVPAVVRILRAQGRPDIVFLQESKLRHEAIREAAGYARAVTSEGGPPLWSLPVILTNRPVLRVFSIPCGAARFRKRAATCALLDMDGETCLACSVHLDHIAAFRRDDDQRVTPDARGLVRAVLGELFEESSRSSCVRELLDRLAEEEKNADFTVLGGDFNTIPLAGAIRLMRSRYDDALAWTPDWLAGTFIKLDFPVKPRIDYIFHSPGLDRDSARVPGASPGDHRPVTAAFRH